MDMVQPPGIAIPTAIMRQEYHVIAAAPVNVTAHTAFNINSWRYAAVKFDGVECAAIASGSCGRRQCVIGSQAFFRMLDDGH